MRRNSYDLATLSLIAALFTTSPAFADDSRALSREDWAVEATWYVIHVIDWGQTLHIAEEYYDCAGFTTCKYFETNPILGPEPTRGEINRYFIASTLVHTGITYLLPPGDTRRAWQYFTIGVSGSHVAQNYSIGVKVSF